MYTKGNRIYVSRVDNLRRELLRECHDSLWAGHPGIHRTLALVDVGKSWGDITCTAEEQENKILDSQRDVRRRAKIGAQNPRNLKLRIE